MQEIPSSPMRALFWLTALNRFSKEDAREWHASKILFRHEYVNMVRRISPLFQLVTTINPGILSAPVTPAGHFLVIHAILS